MTQFITRDYNDITLKCPQGIIVKRSKEERLKNEIEYYQKINEYEVGIFFPRYIGAETDNVDEYVLKIEYHDCENLGIPMINTKMDKTFWQSVDVSLKQMLSSFYNVDNFPIENADKHRESMYIDKTENEYKKLVDNFPVFKQIAEYDSLIINETKYKNFHIVWEPLKKYIKQKLCTKEDFTIIHGDLCFSNILTSKDGNVLKLIDPRGSFGEDGILGDRRYDIAKLFHSFEGGYEFIIYDKFNVKYKDNKFNYCIFNDSRKMLSKFLPSINCPEMYDVDKVDVRLIQGLIYIGMCARHYDNENRQIAMYLTGIKILNEVFNENFSLNER